MTTGAAIRQVLDAWALTAEMHEPEPAASEAELGRAARGLGRQLPADARAVYRTANGGAFLQGNLMLYPLLPPGGDDETLALTTASGLLRSWKWRVPDELVVFGSDGSDDLFGLWLPADGPARHLVVQIAEAFDDASLAVVGTDLAAFLRAWTAFYVLAAGDFDGAAAALDVLGVPSALRAAGESASETQLHALLAWASPGLPDPRPDAYARGLTSEQVRALGEAP